MHRREEEGQAYLVWQALVADAAGKGPTKTWAAGRRAAAVAGVFGCADARPGPSNAGTWPPWKRRGESSV